MELPDSIKELGEQVEAGGEITPDPDLFEAYEVFSAEMTNLFVRPWLAVDHTSRLAVDGDYFRVDVGTRSVILARESADQIHAMRNSCLHAGYRVCEEEGGRSDQLFCRYHGWYYAMDGRLTEPVLRPDETDRSRYRLARFAMRIDRGLILVDPSVAAPHAPEAGPVEFGAVPESLADAVVTSRQRHATTWNWKYLRQFMWSAKDRAFAEDGVDAVTEFGPLSYVALQGQEAALVRLVPRYPGHSDVEIVRMAPAGAAPQANGTDRVGDALRDAGEGADAAPLERGFYDWYWSALSAQANK